MCSVYTRTYHLHRQTLSLSLSHIFAKASDAHNKIRKPRASVSKRIISGKWLHTYTARLAREALRKCTVRTLSLSFVYIGARGSPETPRRRISIMKLSSAFAAVI